jgi:hypothetical protein
MDLDVGAVHAANLAVRSSAEDREQTRPQARGAPAAESGVDRAPVPKFPRQIAPRNTGSKHVPNPGNEGPVILRRTSTTVTFGPIPFSGVVRSIFLAAPRVASVTPNDL